MSTEGTHIYEALDQARKLLVEIARMLEDCDRLMKDRGWDAPKSESVSGISTSINRPHKWMPYVVNRIYVNDEFPKITKVVAVILENEWNDGLSEPLVVGSTYQSVDNEPVTFSFWDHSWWWFKLTDGEANGEVKTITSSESDTAEFNKAFSRFTKIELFGHPMVAVSSTDTIDSRIIRLLVGN